MAEQRARGEEAVERSADSSIDRGDANVRLTVVFGGLFLVAAALQGVLLLQTAGARGEPVLRTVLRFGTPTIGMLAVGFGLGFVYLRRTTVTADRAQ